MLTIATIFTLVLQYSNTYKVDPLLVSAVIEDESGFNVEAKGANGEVGLMQLMPSSFPGYTRNQLKDPKTNLRLGIAYLASMRTNKECTHKNGVEWLVCYNVGPRAAQEIHYPRKHRYYRVVTALIRNKRRYLERGFMEGAPFAPLDMMRLMNPKAVERYERRTAKSARASKPVPKERKKFDLDRNLTIIPACTRDSPVLSDQSWITIKYGRAAGFLSLL